MVRKRKNKKDGQLVHAMERIEQEDRYNLGITEAEYLQLCNYIKRGKRSYPDGTTTKFLERQTLRTTVWLIDWKGEKNLIAVYDKNTKRIATFLPKEWLERRAIYLQDEKSIERK